MQPDAKALAAHPKQSRDTMQLLHEQLPGDVLLIRLVGRLDVQGAQAIDMRFTALAASRAGRILVDLSGLSFLASLGIRTLVSSAKAQATRGGRLVLAGAVPDVREVLEVCGVTELIPLHETLDDARHALDAG